MITVMTIAGSDSGGGAGVQSDLKTFAALGVYGTCAITAITAQNTREVADSFPLPAQLVASQIKTVAADVKLSGAKTGMLYNAAIIQSVADQVRELNIAPLVIDPVMISKSGHRLLLPEAQQAMVEKLFPLATLVTPNLEEAGALADFPVTNLEKMEKAASLIKQMGPQAVLIKGGHLHDSPIDLLYDGFEFHFLEGKRLPAKGDKVHGLGCTLSAALTVFLARGMGLQEAARSAKSFVEETIRYALDVGKGYPVPNHFSSLFRDCERYRLIQEMLETLEKMKVAAIGHLIPEVQSNMAVALPNARGHKDVAGFPGRIVRMGQNVVAVGYPQFGASKHVANIVLTAMKHDPEKKAAMNLRYSPEIIESAKRLHFTVASFDRRKEPHTVKDREGSSLEWGTEEAIKSFGAVPDLIYDLGDMGKEPIVRILAESPARLGEMVLLLHNQMKTGGADPGN